MKKLLLTIGLAGATLCSFAAAYVSAPSYIDGSTNTLVVQGTTNPVSFVVGGFTNSFNLPNVANDTNQWPSIELVPAQSTIPTRFAGFQAGWTMTFSNNAATTFRFAVSGDRTHWLSNYFTVGYITNTAPGKLNTFGTNFDLGCFPFVALQQIEVPTNAGNAGGVGSLSNFFFIPVAKPGL